MSEPERLRPVSDEQESLDERMRREESERSAYLRSAPPVEGPGQDSAGRAQESGTFPVLAVQPATSTPEIAGSTPPGPRGGVPNYPALLAHKDAVIAALLDRLLAAGLL